MKIGPEHIGKTFELGAHRVLVQFVGEDRFFGRCSSIKCGYCGEGSWTNDNHWILVPEEKKPSERIREIMRNLPGSMDLHGARFDAIRLYLDELYESGKLK